MVAFFAYIDLLLGSLLFQAFLIAAVFSFALLFLDRIKACVLGLLEIKRKTESIDDEDVPLVPFPEKRGGNHDQQRKTA